MSLDKNGREELGIKAGDKAVSLKGNYITSFILVAALVMSWGYVLYDTNREHDTGIRQAHAVMEQEAAQHRRDMERLLAALEALARQRP
jgi:hypothetical protein